MKTKRQLLEAKLRRIIKEELLKEAEESYSPEEVASELIERGGMSDLQGYVTLNDRIVFIGKKRIFVTWDFKYGSTTGKGNYYNIEKLK